MPRENLNSPDYCVPMVDHALGILKVLSEANEELALKDISERGDVGRTSAFRILFTLATRGYVHKNPATGKYRLSTKLMEIARRSVGDQKLVHLAHPYLQRLYERFNETVNLAVYQDGEIVYVEILESSRAFRMTAEVGSRVPIHSTALGKVIAAYLPEDVIVGRLRGYEWTLFTPRTIASPTEFLRALRQIRKQGYSLDKEETELGATCLGAAIVDRRQYPLGAISVSGPSHRIRADKEAIIRQLKRTALALSTALQEK
jgi:IclR family transcriptional regulator, KDG regulon repressor